MLNASFIPMIDDKTKEDIILWPWMELDQSGGSNIGQHIIFSVDGSWSGLWLSFLCSCFFFLFFAGACLHHVSQQVWYCSSNGHLGP